MCKYTFLYNIFEILLYKIDKYIYICSMKNIYSNIVTFNRKILTKTVNSLKRGNLASLPTETVYGLAGNAYSKRALRKIYKLKKGQHIIL